MTVHINKQLFIYTSSSVEKMANQFKNFCHKKTTEESYHSFFHLNHHDSPGSHHSDDEDPSKYHHHTQTDPQHMNEHLIKTQHMFYQNAAILQSCKEKKKTTQTTRLFSSKLPIISVKK